MVTKTSWWFLLWWPHLWNSLYFSDFSEATGTLMLTNIRRKQEKERSVVNQMHQAGGLWSRQDSWRFASYILLHIVFLGKVAESIWCQGRAANAILIVTAFDSISFCYYSFHTVTGCSEGVFYCFEKTAGGPKYWLPLVL